MKHCIKNIKLFFFSGNVTLKFVKTNSNESSTMENGK